MIAPGTADDPVLSLSHLPATSHQRGIVFAIAAVLLAAFTITAPFADTQLPSFVSFNPTVEAMVFVNDLVTSILLFSQYSISRARAILALAIGYLYTALIVIPHMLTFPGAFTGILDAGPQTSAWLYYFWTAGTPIAGIAYALLSNADNASSVNDGSTRSIIAWSAALVIGLVSGITWITTARHQFLPSLMSDDHYSNTVVYIANPLAILIAAVAFALLWSRRRSVLDYWLLLVIFSLILNFVIAAFLARQRYSLGFYVSRGFTLVTSMLVLALLLREMTNLYTRLARSNMILERQRDNLLMNAQAIVAAIAHEVRQPLTRITAGGSAAQRFLKMVPPEHDKAQTALEGMVNAGHRTSEVIDGFRALFAKGFQRKQLMDINDIIRGALESLSGELNDHHVEPRSELMSELPHVYGNKSQLQEVVSNLMINAIEAMETTSDQNRVLRVRTELRDHKTIAVAVEDSGPGIDKDRLDRIFTAFVTTKRHGMGLGLAICRMIIEYHGGELTASSEGKDGASFQFILPIASIDTDGAQGETTGP
jgi:signal transduction histidine kinase